MKCWKLSDSLLVRRDKFESSIYFHLHMYEHCLIEYTYVYPCRHTHSISFTHIHSSSLPYYISQCGCSCSEDDGDQGELIEHLSRQVNNYWLGTMSIVLMDCL